ncbi:hypothetical protein NUACC21_44250 [Scytonema sp. NUACC21]
MPKESIQQFHEEFIKNEELKQKVRTITTYRELIKLGENYGYSFTAEDIAEANAAYQETEQKVSLNDAVPSSEKNSYQVYHYDFKWSELQKFAEIIPEFEKLKIKPSTVDIKHFESLFREDDFNFNSISPASPEFKPYHDAVTKSDMESKEFEPLPEYIKRSFHLINLDLHVTHQLYKDYFFSKFKIIKFMENLFEEEVRFSGSLWYPPNAYRLWHTNETQPGWRMYWIDFDNFDSNTSQTSFFRYMNPETKELVTLYEQPKIVRFFKVENSKDKLFWHCIANPTKFNRWSFGFAISDRWMEKLLPG